MKMSEIRAQYPEYADLPDEQIVIGLHRKFYPDMPFKDFHKNIQYDVLPPEPKLDPSKFKPGPSTFSPLSGATYDGKPITQSQVAELMKDKKAMPGFGEGVPKLANDLGGKVTDLTGSPATGYVANIATQAIPALLSSYRQVGEPLASMAERPARALMQSALKPSSTVPPNDLKQALGTMLQEGISPTRGGMDKASQLAQKMNDMVKVPIAASNAEISIPEVVKGLDPLRAKVAMQVNPESDIAAVEKAISEFKNSPAVSNAESIPVQLAQKLKTGTYGAIGEKAYGELGSSSIEAQKQLARQLREGVLAKVPEIAEPLKREAELRNVMEVAATRAAIDANKNPLSLGTSIAAIMHDPLSAAGMWANASTPVKAMLARMLFTGGRPDVALPATIAAKEALNQDRGE